MLVVINTEEFFLVGMEIVLTSYEVKLHQCLILPKKQLS